MEAYFKLGGQFGEFCLHFLLHFGLVFLGGFLPYEAIPVRVGFQLCPVNEDTAQGQFSCLGQKFYQLGKQILYYVAQAFASEAGDGGMVGSPSPAQQIHEVDVSPAGLLQFSAGINAVHVSVYQYLEESFR